jgi:hypothetical protein
MGMRNENEPVLIVDGLADLGVPALRQHVQDRRHRPQRLQPGLAIKNPPKKPQKNPHKKPTKKVFFGFFLIFNFFYENNTNTNFSL